MMNRAAKIALEISWEVRIAGHHCDGVAIILVARPEAIEEFIQPQHTLGHFPHRLKSDRDAIVRKGSFYLGQFRFAAKIAVFLPHCVELLEATAPLYHSPFLIWENAGHPQHHPKTQILSYEQFRSRQIDQSFHLRDFLAQRLFAETSVRNIAIESIKRA